MPLTEYNGIKQRYSQMYYFYFLIILAIGLIIELSGLFIKYKIKPKIKGYAGEKLVSSTLSFRLPKEQYRILNNILLKTDRGSTQIDHIIVSVYGIFVIETKNYTGWITGGEYSEKWTQTIYKNKTQFYNPIKTKLRSHNGS